MAGNEIQVPGNRITMVLASVASGDPVMYGSLPGVATTATQADGTVTADCSGSEYSLNVKGVITGPANQAVNAGDLIYFTSGHTPKLDKDSTAGVLFGVAIGLPGAAPVAAGTQLIASGGTGVITVKIARI